MKESLGMQSFRSQGSGGFRGKGRCTGSSEDGDVGRGEGTGVGAVAGTGQKEMWEEHRGLRHLETGCNA